MDAALYSPKTLAVASALLGLLWVGRPRPEVMTSMHLSKHRHRVRQVIASLKSTLLRTTHRIDSPSSSSSPDKATPPSDYLHTSLNNSATASENTLAGSDPDLDTLDPLTTASIRNNRSSFIYRLPEEILLLILDQIHCSDDDIITYYCLRRVSRLFRRLVHADPVFLNHAVQATEDYSIVRCALAPPYWKLQTRLPWFRETFDCQPGLLSALPNESRDTLCRYLRKDQICASCLRRCELNGAVNKHSGRIPYGTAVWTGCKFGSWAVTYAHLFCWACMATHPTLAFSPSQALLKKYKGRPGRACIGRQGYIRLCQHKTVTWAEVERFMVNGARMGLVTQRQRSERHTLQRPGTTRTQHGL